MPSVCRVLLVQGMVVATGVCATGCADGVRPGGLGRDRTRSAPGPELASGESVAVAPPETERRGASGDGDEAPRATGPERSRRFSAADLSRRATEVRKRLPPSGFTVVVEPPFVVVGDEKGAVVRERSVRTVRWAAERLKRSYFARDPEVIIEIWLFKDKESYERNAKRFFGETPTTPFGYYSSTHRALIMNIATGGGTLVHELVHPFLAANFPSCPAWFNEGLASLYEQCDDRAGRIHGLTNWRLPGLQQAIRAETLPPLKDLMAATAAEFYAEDSGRNYAQARYLCYYLQEKDLLESYYRRFTESVRDDPTGYRTLGRVLEAEDMDSFDSRWRKFVLGLRFP